MTAATHLAPIDNKPLAILMRIGAGIAASSLVATVKAASNAGVSAGEILFYRNAGALPVVIAWIMLGPGLAALGTRRPLAHLTRSALGLASMTLMFVTIGLLPIAEFTAFLFLVPLFATMLSALFLGEKVGLHRWGAILLGFAGVLVMTHPGGGGVATTGLAMGLVTAAMVSGVTITLRGLGATEPATTTVFWFTLIGTLATALTLPFFYQPHDAATWIIVAGIGLAGALLQIFQTISLRLAPVSVTAPFDYMQLVWSMLLGWLIWETIPARATITGAMLIGLAGLYTIYREHKRASETAAASTAIS